MSQTRLQYYVPHWYNDLFAGIVVFLVALPLCLSIALASGAPPFAGLIGGIIGGVVVSIVSGSQLSVSGPANGVVIVSAAAIASFGYRGFLLSVVLAGLLQLALGLLRAGSISAYFPSSVVKGVLSAIGLMLILKQLPHVFGYVYTAQDDLSYFEEGGATQFSALAESLRAISPGPVLLTLASLIILVIWEMEPVKKNRWLSLVPGALVVVIFGVIYNIFTRAFVPGVAIATEHLVSLPVFSSLEEFWQSTAFPDFSLITNMDVIHTAVSLAVIASLESLLSLEATDKLDPLKRIAPTDQELLAQGTGNILSGLIGGLPISAIIVRSSVNINAGAHTKIASIVHGVLILASAFFLSEFLNLIPLSCLAAILIVTGYKLTSPSLYIDVYSRGYSQFIPFVVTVFSILALDTLRGIIIGLLVGIVFVVKNNFQTAFTLIRHENTYLLRLRKDVSFLNKAPLRKLLGSIDNGADLLIDGSRADYIDMEILEALEDFQKAATDRNIRVEFKNIRGLQEPGSVSAAPLFQDAG